MYILPILYTSAHKYLIIKNKTEQTFDTHLNKNMGHPQSHFEVVCQIFHKSCSCQLFKHLF